ncbi:MAG: PQQ-binding-like beta-propeller repeat protein [Gemmataceae bacterium]|nr:PQQ-binding-like beta-propeller repeat protein [Gemmataceae bacterium]
MKPFRLAMLFSLVAVALHAADWPTFRGNAAQDGTSPNDLPHPLTQLWQFQTGKGEDSIDAAPVVVGRTVFVAAQDSHLYALDLENGAEIWRFKAPAPLKTSPAVHDDRVYFGDVDGNFFCVEAAGGKEVWKFKADGEVASGTALAGDRILFGCGDESLYCLDRQGRKLWQFQVPGGPVLGTPSVFMKQTFVSGCDSAVHVVELDTGKESKAIEIGGQTGAAPALRDGKLYLATMSNTVVAVDLEKAEVLWAFDSGRGQPFYASCAVTDRFVIAASRDKRVYCLDRATGKRLWDFVTGGRIEGSPVVAGSRVYAGSMDGHLYVIDLEKGAELQRVKLDGPVTGSLAIAHRRLLLGTQNGTVYCFGSK